MKRVFLDANVLFSAAYREGNGLLQLWSLDLTLVTSLYAFEEARRNLESKRREGLMRLISLMSSVELASVTHSPSFEAPLPEKDKPILEAALLSGCTYLVTGDIADFGNLLGTVWNGVEVMTPRSFLQSLGEE